MKKQVNLFIAASVFYAGSLYAQFTHGPTLKAQVHFSHCLPLDKSGWNVSLKGLSCEKVTLIEAPSYLHGQRGFVKGKSLPIQDVFIAPVSSDPGLKKIIDFSTLKAFCSSVNTTCTNFLKSLVIDDTILSNHTPFIQGVAISPKNEAAMILVQGYYDNTGLQGKTLQEIYTMNIPGHFYLLSYESLDGAYNIEDNDDLEIINDGINEDSKVFVVDRSRQEIKLAQAVKAGVKIYRMGSRLVKYKTLHPVIKTISTLSGFMPSANNISGVIEYDELPLVSQRPEGMFDNIIESHWWPWRSPKKEEPQIQPEQPIKAEPEPIAIPKIQREPQTDFEKLVAALSGDLKYRQWLVDQAEKCQKGTSGFSERVCEIILLSLSIDKNTDTLLLLLPGRGARSLEQVKSEIRNRLGNVKYLAFRLNDGKILVVIFSPGTEHIDMYKIYMKEIFPEDSDFLAGGFIKNAGDGFDISFDSSSMRNESDLERDKPKSDQEAKEVLEKIKEAIKRLLEQ